MSQNYGDIKSKSYAKRTLNYLKRFKNNFIYLHILNTDLQHIIQFLN